MADVVQIKCPHCQNSLRIPANWQNQTMRCKHCQQVFQAKKKASPLPVSPGAPVAAPAAQAPPAKKAAAAPASANPFAFEGAETTIKVPRTKPQRRGFGKVQLALLGCGVLTLAGVAAVFLVVMLGNQLLKLLTPEPGTEQVQSGLKKDTPSIRDSKPTPPDTKVTPSSGETPADTAKDTGSSKETKKTPETPKEPDPPPIRTQDIYPRRALLISVNDYVLAPTLVYGKPPQGDFKGSSPRAFADRLIANLDFPRKQVAELSDKANPPIEPLKSAIEATIVEFLKTSRAQDNILLLFAGHATEIDKEAYLVPKDGKPKDTKSLIALAWLYKQMEECKARQKVLILDVCRFNPGRGANAEPMGPVLEGKLKQPPPGVQVLAACSVQQQSLETDGGSLFLELLCKRCDGLPTPPEYAIPIKRLAAGVAADLEAATLKSNRPQKELLAGAEPGKGPYSPKEPLPPDVVAKAPAPPQPQSDNPALKAVVDELNLFPPTTGGTAPPLTPSLFVDFLPKADKFKADYVSILDFKTKEAESPLRYNLARGILALQENVAKIVPIRHVIPGKAPDKALKDSVRNEQQRIGKLNFLLRDAMRDLIAVGDKYRDDETKRVQLLYNYTLLRMKARLIYSEEYNFALAEIMKDSVPTLEEGDKVYRLTAQEKVNINETSIKELVKDLKKSLPQFVKTYAETPWGIMAQREQAVMLGLAWKSAKQ